MKEKVIDQFKEVNFVNKELKTRLRAANIIKEDDDLWEYFDSEETEKISKKNLKHEVKKLEHQISR